MHKRFALLSVLAMLATVLPALPALAQPTNDNFADATAVNSYPFADSVGIADATTETGEPVEVCAPMAGTVWYALTLDESSLVMIDTAGSGFDTVLAVWQGTDLSSLNLVKCIDDTSLSVESRMLLSADAGQTYLIQAGAFGSTPTGATLNLSIGEPPNTTGKPVIYKGSSKGTAAQASLDTYDETTSSSTGIYLVEGRSKFAKGKPYKMAEVDVYWYQSAYDEGAGTYTWESWYGANALEPGKYQLDAKLRNAWVNTTVTLFGQSCVEGPYVETEEGYEYEVSCEELGPIEVQAAVSWTGQGPNFKYSYNERSTSGDGYRSSYGGSSTARDADVAGTIAGDGLFFDLGDAYGALMKDSNRYMTVYRGISAY